MKTRCLLTAVIMTLTSPGLFATVAKLDSKSDSKAPAKGGVEVIAKVAIKTSAKPAKSDVDKAGLSAKVVKMPETDTVAVRATEDMLKKMLRQRICEHCEI